MQIARNGGSRDAISLSRLLATVVKIVSGVTFVNPRVWYRVAAEGSIRGDEGAKIFAP
jgi:hypothetical protein